MLRRAARASDRLVGSGDSSLSKCRSRSVSGFSLWIMYWNRSDQSSQPCCQSNPTGSAYFTLAPAFDSSFAVASTTEAVAAETCTSGLLVRTAMRSPLAVSLGVGPSGTGAASVS